MNAKRFITKLDQIAKKMFGEFGYDTCGADEKLSVMQAALDSITKGRKTK